MDSTSELIRLYSFIFLLKISASHISLASDFYPYIENLGVESLGTAIVDEIQKNGLDCLFFGRVNIHFKSLL